MPAATAQWMPLDDVLTCFHPQNPIVHDQDIPGLALSLLEGGWIEPVTLNQNNGKLVGGHGRSLAAQWLRQQAVEWFDHRWELWSAEHKPTEADRQRFNPEYWTQVLVLLVALSEADHLAMMIRLNDTENQGKDNPDRLKALLSQLPGRLRQMAGYPDQPTVDRSPVAIEQPAAPDVEGKQYFESPDATDYRVQNPPDPDTADHFSGDVTSYQDDEQADEDEEPEDEPKAPPPMRALSISLTWQQWKQWNNWKRSRDIARDTDAFAAGHAAYKVTE